ncbi:MAG: A/G-specific adenine glycosylase [Anaerolineae bacterium]|nr:A/G-specific adenine glycosylase [Anaerolineae bacterium]
MSDLNRAAIVAALLDWFGEAAVSLPWRDSSDPYRVWLSEIMLQQTQVTTVIPYFQRFLDAYPTVQALAAAPLEDVLKRWEGLGYYSRARHMHRAAQQVAAHYGGVFPRTARELQTLPGVGRYTANAIASMAYGEHVPVLDGNVMRVLSRLADVAEDVTAARTQRRLWELAESFMEHVPPGRAGSFNQAAMELGREVCKPRRPLCAECPVRAHCLARQRGVQEQRPVKARRAPTPHHDYAAALIEDRAGRILIARRRADGLLGGLWEFPAGRCEPGETLPECLARALHDKLAVKIVAGDERLVVKHAFSHFRLTLHVLDARIVSGAPAPQGDAYTDARWVGPGELEQYAFGRADRKVIEHLSDFARRLF